MSILFSVVAIKREIIYKHASCDGNFVDIVTEVLSKIPLGNNKMTYFHGTYLFNYVVENEHVYLCVTEKACQRSRAFLFLNEIKRSYKCHDTDDFTNTLAIEMSRYSENNSNITVENGDLDEINRIEVESSQSILGEKLLLVKNTDILEFSTISYVRKSPEKITISVESKTYFIFVGMALFLTVIVLYVFGPWTLVTVMGILFINDARKKRRE
ncbi:unnamed protein product, partial [Iphiclides podalirius]